MTPRDLADFARDLGQDTREFVRDRLREAVAPLEQRIAALEARGPGVDYRGVFEADSSYPRGSLVTRGGALWLAQLDTRGEAPGQSAAWKLVVKRGAVE